VEIRLKTHEGDDTYLEGYLRRLHTRIGALEAFKDMAIPTLRKTEQEQNLLLVAVARNPIKPEDLKKSGFYFAEHENGLGDTNIFLVRFDLSQCSVYNYLGLAWDRPSIYTLFYGPIKPEHYGATV
jgi:hypothetical protein